MWLRELAHLQKWTQRTWKYRPDYQGFKTQQLGRGHGDSFSWKYRPDYQGFKTHGVGELAAVRRKSWKYRPDYQEGWTNS